MMTFRFERKPPALKSAVIVCSLLLPLSTQTLAGEADVLAAEMRPGSNGKFTVSATVRHDDTGWEHYADAFEVLAPDGTELATRVLHHPHENEQPFTRSLSGVEIPVEMDHIIIRAHDNVHGYGGATIKLEVQR